MKWVNSTQSPPPPLETNGIEVVKLCLGRNGELWLVPEV
jgi:hypothetical protein